MRQMKSSNQIKRTVICRQLAVMELEPYGIQIKRKAAVHAWLPVLSRFKGLSLPSLCHSTLQMTRLADTLNMRYLYHTQPHPRSLTNLNCKIASSLIKTILTSFQISQVYNDGNQKAKSYSDIANTYVIDYLECQLFKSGVTQLLDFSPLDKSAWQPFFLFFFAFALQQGKKILINHLTC